MSQKPDDDKIDDEMGSIWVRTDPDADGVYRPVIEFPDNPPWVLDAARATGYAIQLMSAVATAEYEAKVLRQLTSALRRDLGPAPLMKPDEALAAAGQMIADLREARPEPPPPISPLTLLPGVSAFTGEAFLALFLNGKGAGQWTPEDTRSHVMAVLEAVTVAELDNAYLRQLMAITVDEDTARAMVGDLQKYS